jgi:hypothetical protein
MPTAKTLKFMRNTYIIITLSSLFLLLSTTGRAQYFELGVMGGISAYQGDLLEKNVSTSNAHMAGGAFFRYDRSRIALRASLNYGTISGDDAVALDNDRRIRNLSFRSRIAEFSGIFELNLFKFEQNTFRKSKHSHPFTPVVFAGISMFRFNPKAFYHNEWVALQPLSTEGQGASRAYGAPKKYSLTQIAFPLGFGFKYNLSPKMNLGFEVGARVTMTDYLDDVSGNFIDRESSSINVLTSQLTDRSGEVTPTGIYVFRAGDPRGNPAKKDSYYFAGMTLSVVIPARQMRCFRF